MSKTLSLDLRVRVLAAVADGASHRAVALRFGVSAASVSRWRRRAAAQGDPGPKALGGDRRSGRIEQHREQILGVLADQPDLTIEELRRALAARGLRFGFGTLQRFLVRHQNTRARKNGHSSEQDHMDMRQHRQTQPGTRALLDPSACYSSMRSELRTSMACIPVAPRAASGCR